MVGLIYAWSARSLAEESDALFARAIAMPPGHMPEITRAAPVQPPRQIEPDPGALARLRTFLKPEIDQGLVTVTGTEATPIVRISNRGLFASGSATLNPQFLPLLGRIGQALRTEPGVVDVQGHTDNQPIRTVQFPSNFQLSTARARAASAALAAAIDDPARLRTEGRADAGPVGPNSTPEGREQNRRIEVVLHRPG